MTPNYLINGCYKLFYAFSKINWRVFRFYVYNIHTKVHKDGKEAR